MQEFVQAFDKVMNKKKPEPKKPEPVNPEPEKTEHH